VPRLLSLTRGERDRCRATTRRCGERRAGRLVGVAGSLETFFRTVAVDVTAHAPAHVQRGVLIDPIHLLDLAMAGLAGHAGIDVARVREVDVFGKLVNPDPGNRLGVRAHAGAHAR